MIAGANWNGRRQISALRGLLSVGRKPISDQVHEFVALVRQYLALVDGAEDTSAHELLTYSARLLPRIYAAGLELPDVSLADEVEASDEVVSPMSKLGRLFGRFDVYFEVFDPVFEQDAVASSLSDDLADIYLDLARPLAAFDAGQQGDAVWQWRFNIRGHCGDHIVDALRAIHRLVNDHLTPDYRSDVDTTG